MSSLWPAGQLVQRKFNKRLYCRPESSVAGMFWGLLDPDSLVRGTDPFLDHSIIKQINYC
jgi:hypothetical protein